MSFDIRQLDGMDEAAYSEAYKEYKKALLEDFHASLEGQAYLAEFPDSVSWVDLLLEMGHNYPRVTLPQMTKSDVEEILTDLFPRKVMMTTREEIAEVIPELQALWRYLGREHGLDQAEAILGFLEELRPRFYDVMTDSSNFGMAKSLLAMGHDAGFDVTSEEGLNAFMTLMQGMPLDGLPDVMSGDLRRSTGSHGAASEASALLSPLICTLHEWEWTTHRRASQPMV